jgi:hypothetical protein
LREVNLSVGVLSARLGKLEDGGAGGGERHTRRDRRLFDRARGFLAGGRLIAECLVHLSDATHRAGGLGADLDNDVTDAGH